MAEATPSGRGLFEGNDTFGLGKGRGGSPGRFALPLVWGFSYDRVFVVFRWTGSPYQRVRGFSYARGWTVVFFNVGGNVRHIRGTSSGTKSASRDAPATLGMSVAPEAAASVVARYHGTARCG